MYLRKFFRVKINPILTIYIFVLVIKQNPGISFSKVASELASRWRNLGDIQKNMYAEKAKLSKNQKSTNLAATKTRPLIKKQIIIVNTSVNIIKEQLHYRTSDRYFN